MGLVYQLLARCAEHVEAALAAFATASGPSAELVARVALESAITIRYIMRAPDRRLAAYFRHHVDEADKQVRNWRRAAASLPDDSRVIHETACNQREVANDAMRSLVDRIERDLLGSHPLEKWPAQVSERFKALNEEVTYRTVYARLSSETHFDAEETLRYLLAQLADADVKERMALETIMFTRLMISIGVTYFLHATLDYASRYDMRGTLQVCRSGLDVMDSISAVPAERVDSGHGRSDPRSL